MELFSSLQTAGTVVLLYAASEGVDIQWRLRITDTLGKWLLSVIEGLSASRRLVHKYYMYGYLIPFQEVVRYRGVVRFSESPF